MKTQDPVFKSGHLVFDHFQRHFGRLPPLDALESVAEQINDIRRYVHSAGLYVSQAEWPDFVERFCEIDDTGSIYLNRMKLLMAKKVSEIAAIQLLGQELQQDPEMREQLGKFFERRVKGRRTRPDVH